MNNSGKRFVGNGKEKMFDSGNSVINLRIRMSDLANIDPDSYGKIGLTVTKMRQPDKFGYTHSVCIDEYWFANKDKTFEQSQANQQYTKRNSSDEF